MEIPYARIYHALCIIVTIVLTSWCIYEYQLDRDITAIELRKFYETPDDIHPSITLCDKDPFEYSNYIEKEKTWRGENIVLRYASIILGEEGELERIQRALNNDSKFNDYVKRIENIDYDDVTVRLEDVM